MDSDEFANLLMAEDRKDWQDPDAILDQVKIFTGSISIDLGCGPGFFTIPMAKKSGKTGSVFAVDKDPVMLKHLEKNLETVLDQNELAKITPVLADISDTRLPPEVADFVLLANILHDLDDPVRFFDEVKRILKKRGGLLINIDWQKFETENMGPPIDWRLSENDSRELLRSNDFRIIHALNAGPYHYGFVAKLESDV